MTLPLALSYRQTVIGIQKRLPPWKYLLSMSCKVKSTVEYLLDICFPCQATFHYFL